MSGDATDDDGGNGHRSGDGSDDPRSVDGNDDQSGTGSVGGSGESTDGTTGAADGDAQGRSGGPIPTDLPVDTEGALEELDRQFVDLLAWLLETETHARIYVYLRQEPNSTSEEVAEGTSLYPSTVRESLAEMAEDGVLERQKRQHAGAGNNPYEYAAIAPSDLVGRAVSDLQSELNSVFNLDCLLGCTDRAPADDAVTISVETDEAEGD